MTFTPDSLSHLTHHTLRLTDLGAARVTVARYEDDGGRVGPVAVTHGELNPTPDDGVLVRLQSSCIYGEVLRSVDCDCRDQLDLALDLIRRAGVGVLVYLDQEGRGAGLWTKALGYSYSQQHDVDSFAAYRSLGSEPDVRDYTAAARLLKDLGITKVRLLTNNLRKVDGLTSAGVDATRVALVPPLRPEFAAYLDSKRRQGHLIPRYDRERPAGPAPWVHYA